jgi:DNA-binding NtrC family response regulator
MISDDPTMRPVVRLALKAAVCRANVLLVGESGVGKAYIARKIHEGAGHPPGSFSSLFGMPDEDGSPGADGLVSHMTTLEPGGGTIYVRDIDLLGLCGQRELLSYLDARERGPGPGNGQHPARLVFSSQKDLLLESMSGRYLRQLYLRASVIKIMVPPLRSREEDIVSLARHFVDLFSSRERKAIGGLSHDAECLLRNLSWEGNIHELKNTMNRAVVLADNGQVLSAGMFEGAAREAVG